MTMNLHIIRKTAMGVVLLITLIAILATGASAQNYPTDPASVPSPISSGSTINSDTSATLTPPIRSNPNQVPANASLLAVPVVGNAPLTVDFYVGLTTAPGSLFYEWNFGDGAQTFVPAQPYIIHVYQNPGTYICQLELFTPQGVSSTAFTTISVKARPG